MVVLHLKGEECLSHAVVEGEERRVVENYVYHLLEFVGTLREEERELTCDLELLDVLGGHSVAESVGDW